MPIPIRQAAPGNATPAKLGLLFEPAAPITLRAQAHLPFFESIPRDLQIWVPDHSGELHDSLPITIVATFESCTSTSTYQVPGPLHRRSLGQVRLAHPSLSEQDR